MAIHAALGGSKAKQWMNCPGSIALEAGLPNYSSDAADEGTAYHFLASHCLTFARAAEEFVGQPIYIVKGDGTFDKAGATNEFVVDAENAVYCQEYIDYVLTVAAGNTLLVEEAMSITHLTDEEGAESTADAIIVNENQAELTVVDLKFGRGVEVRVENNPQLMMYGLAAFDTYVAKGFQLNTVRLVIHQPRSGDGKPQEWVMPIEELLEFRDKLRRASGSVWAALELYNGIMDAGAPEDIFKSWWETNLLPDTETCRWCRAKSRCPALGNVVEQITLIDFADLTLTELPPVKHADNTELAKKLNKAPLVELWLKAVRSDGESEMLSGADVPGWKLVRGKRGNRKWSDEAAVEAQLKKYRFTYEQKYDMKLKSPAAFEKLLKKDEPKKLEALLAYVTQADGGLSIAPESDPRPAESAVQEIVTDDMPDAGVDDLL